MENLYARTVNLMRQAVAQVDEPSQEFAERLELERLCRAYLRDYAGIDVSAMVAAD